MKNSKNRLLEGMKFNSSRHQDRYVEILGRMRSNNPEHASLAYLLALIDAPASYCFDFASDRIRREAIDDDWTTESSRRVLTLGFNLWNYTITAFRDTFRDGQCKKGRMYIFELQRQTCYCCMEAGNSSKRQLLRIHII